jgi:26S proteasome regulatory subunit N1
MGETAKAPTGAKEKEKKDGPKEDPLSEEDQKEKEELEACVEKVRSLVEKDLIEALGVISLKLKTATSTMTSVPRPLKFLRPYYEELKELFDKAPAAAKASFADVLSFLATGAANAAMDALLRKLQDKEKQEKKKKAAEEEARAQAVKEGKIVVEDEEEEKKKKAAEEEAGVNLADIDLSTATGMRESLKYRLVGTATGFTDWGNAYLSNLAGEIVAEYSERTQKKESVSPPALSS